MEFFSIITHGATTLAALSKADVKIMMQKKLLEKRNLNLFPDLDTFAPIDDRTVDKYLAKMKATEKKGKVNPESRIEPYKNIRNALSKASTFLAIEKICPAQNWHSDDEVDSFLFGWNTTKPKLVGSQEANLWLRANNGSLSTSEDPNQQRRAHIGILQQLSRGELTSFYVRITDSKFPEVFRSDVPTERKPVIMTLNPLAYCYLVMCYSSVTDTTASEYIGKTDKEQMGMVHGSLSQHDAPEPLNEGIIFLIKIKCLFSFMILTL